MTVVGSRRIGTAALVAGIVVLLVTVASQVGLGPGDFATVAALGLLSSCFCLVAAVRWRTGLAWAGLGLSLLPVVLLVFFLAVSDG